MCPGGNFWNDAAEGPMLFPLRADDVGEDPSPTGALAHDDAGRRLVAARFDAEDDEGAVRAGR